MGGRVVGSLNSFFTRRYLMKEMSLMEKRIAQHLYDEVEMPASRSGSLTN